MDKQKVIQMASAIRAAIETVHISGTNNMAQLIGIANTAEAIIAEVKKEEEAST